MTYFKYKKAKQQNVGSGKPVKNIQYGRVKFDENQLEHFVDFKTSGHIVKDLPFGEKKMPLVKLLKFQVL